MQAELQSESEATAEGEDSVVEAAAVTGVPIRKFHHNHGTSNYKRQGYCTDAFLYVLCTGCSYPIQTGCPLCTGYNVSTPGSVKEQ